MPFRMAWPSPEVYTRPFTLVKFLTSNADFLISFLHHGLQVLILSEDLRDTYNLNRAVTHYLH